MLPREIIVTVPPSLIPTSVDDTCFFFFLLPGSLPPVVRSGVCHVRIHPGLQGILHRVGCEQGGTGVSQAPQ